MHKDAGDAIAHLVAWPLVALVWLLAACGDDGLTGPAADSCPAGPYFSALPVALADINLIAVFGGLGAPGHTLPTAHAGFALRTEGAQIFSPGNIQITRLRRVRYLVSPRRQGAEDYATEFQVCQDVSGWFGHVTSLASSIPVPQNGWRDCQQYSTADETVETCSATLDKVTVTAGQPIGRGGHSIALGLMGLDFGLRDRRVNNFYIARSRHNPDTFQSICPWDQFEPALKTQLYTKLADPGRPQVVPAGEPRCGTMEVDVLNTAKGVWAVAGTQPTPGNETNYVTLANYPYRPVDHLALSLGPAALGAMVTVVPRQNSGRVNRAFEQVANDGLIYCYGPDASYPTASWLLGMTGAGTLSMQRVTHTLGASPCLNDPATWSLTGAVNLVR
ncbi:MAG TPA: hypothetical protein VK864_06110 [Longimicrobiales bacterium]|nr:hypothetical protein [Longimicrobiales bacterium]